MEVLLGTIFSPLVTSSIHKWFLGEGGFLSCWIFSGLFAMFFLELLDFQNVVLTTVCHDKTRVQILSSKSPSSGEVVN